MQTIEADCRSGDEISDYLSTALKGWGIWVSNRLPGSHSAERMGGEKLSGRKKQPYHWGINPPIFTSHILYPTSIDSTNFNNKATVTV